jgi:hypothetical protein
MRTIGRRARSLGSIARSPPTPTDAGTIDADEETALALVRRLLGTGGDGWCELAP